MKRCLCLLLCITAMLAFSVLPVWGDGAEVSGEPVTDGAADPVNGVCGDALTWAITDTGEFQTLTISGSGAMEDYTVSSPAPWAYCAASLDRITMEEGITEVGSCAFAGCANPELVLAGTLTALHSDAFSGDFSSSPVYYNGTRTQWSAVEGSEQLASVGSFTYNYYTVTFDPNGGTCEVEAMILPRQTANNLPTPTREGYTFTGWFSEAEGGENLRDTASTEDITVYAHWVEEPDTLSGDVTETIQWALDMDTGILTLTGTGAVPDYTDGTEAPWWEARDYVSNIVVGSGITEIGNYAFSCMQGSYVKAMGTVTLPKGLTAVGDYAFSQSAFTGVTFPETLTDIGAHAFEANSLSVLELPASLKTIGEYAFADCGTLYSVTVSEGITALPEGCFDGCDWLQTLTLPTTIETLGKDAFTGENDRSFRFSLSEKSFTLTVTPSKEKSFAGWRITGGGDTYTNEELAANGVPAEVTALWEDITETTVEFTDVKDGDWFSSYVTYCAKKGIMNGTGNDRFSPNRTATRGQVVTVLYRMAGEPAYAGTSDFTDVTDPTAYYYDAVRWAAEVGITTGYPDGKFYPNTTVTRQQFVTFLFRYAQQAGIVLNDYDADQYPLNFPDAEEVASWATEAVIWSVERGIQDGVLTSEGTYLQPTSSVSRAQLATFLARFDTNYYRIMLSDMNDAFGNAPVSELVNRIGDTTEKTYVESCLCIGGYDGVWSYDFHGLDVTVYTLKYDDDTEIFLYLEIAE